MATFLQLQNRTYAEIRDANKTFVLLQEVKDWINEAQLELAARLRCLDAEQSTTFPDGTGIVSLPADFLDIETFRVGTDDVTFVDNRTFWEFQDEAITLDDSTPHIGRIFNGKIELYPAPVSGAAYKMRYVKSPVDLSADADVSALPIEWHVRMSFYATARAEYKLNETEMGDRYIALYQEGLPPIRSPRSRNRPRVHSMVVEAGSFDVDPEAMHI